jgi:hypothetical protein
MKEEYVYDIDFEKYVDEIVNSDDENDKINIIIKEKEFYALSNIKNIYNKGTIYTNNLKKVNFNDYSNTFNEKSPKSIVNEYSDDVRNKKFNNYSNIFNEKSPKSIFNECSDDVRNKKFNNFIPKGKYVFSYK